MPPVTRPRPEEIPPRADTSPPGAETRRRVRERMSTAVDAVGTVLRGNRKAIELVFASVLARGHVLLEDVPGVGKTTLARAVARVLGCTFARIQFTSDLLPSDVLGVQVLDASRASFTFKRGPIFAHVVLADEINRASPKTQSAMLEAMADRQVTVDDQTLELEQPFVVIATQNPVEHHGAYPLPESQLDRFMVCTALGYPSAQEERALLLSPSAAGDALAQLGSLLDPAQVREAQQAVDGVVLSPMVADYVLALVQATRAHPDVLLGCSPRGALAFASLSRAWALVHGRDFVIPDDVKELALPVLGHRMIVGAAKSGRGRSHAALVVEDILSRVVVPR